MKILLVSMLFFPDNHIGAVRPTNFARYLASFGHEVTVLTTQKEKASSLPGLTSYEVGMGRLTNYINKKVKDRHVNKIAEGPRSATIERPGRIKTSVLLMLDHLRGFSWRQNCSKLIKKESLGPFDIVISSFGPVGSFTAGRMIRRKLVANWVCDLRDRIPNPNYPAFFNKLYRKYERIALREADAVILVSEGQRQSFISEINIKDSNKVYIINNGYNDYEGKDSKLHTDHQTLRLCYTGTLYGRYEAIEILLSALGDLSTKAKDIVLEYAGPDGKRLTDMAKEFGVCVNDHGFVQRSQALSLQNSCDALVALAWNEPDSLGILSGKFFEYMALKKPIISIVTGSLPNSEMTKMVRELKLGVSCEQTGGQPERERLKDYILMQYNNKKEGRPLLFEAHMDEIEMYSYLNLTRALEGICLSIAKLGKEKKL